MSKKICFFMDTIQGSGGISRVNWLVISGLNTKEYEIHVLGLFKGGNKRYFYPEEIKTAYLFKEQISNSKRFIKAVKAVREYIVENKIEIFICSGEINFPIVSAALIGLQTKLICWEHSNVSVQNEHKFQRTCRFIGAKTADVIVTLTKKDKQLYRDTYHVKKCVHIYNPVDDQLIKEVKYDREAKKIISVGRLCYQKNFECTIKVAEKVLKRYPEWRWDIYGEGEEYTILNQMIAEKKLNGKVCLMGRVDDLYDRYKKYSMLVMTSRFEGFPMTLLESTATGLPAVSFDVLTGPNEIIDNGENGYLVKFELVDTMVEKICYLIDHPEIRQRMSDYNCYKRLEFRKENIIDKWEDLLANF